MHKDRADKGTNLTRPPKSIDYDAFPLKTNGLCTFPDCKRLVTASSLCRGHYNQQWQGKALEPLGKYEMGLCDETGRVCVKCRKHKPYTDFYLRASGRTVDSKCKECAKAVAIESRLKREGRSV